MNLKLDEINSHYQVKDFMKPLSQSPSINENDFSFKSVLESIDKGKLGFSLIVDTKKKLKGISSNADIRKGLLSNINNFKNMKLNDVINSNPITINEKENVSGMLNLIKSKSFPIMYLPVVNDDGEAKGVITFLNLIKGEL